MPDDDERPSAMLAPREERIQSYLQPTQSTDDIVREVTTAFATEVARIMADVDNRGTRAGRQQPDTRRRDRRR
jgi:hypothetical protein